MYIQFVCSNAHFQLITKLIKNIFYNKLIIYFEYYYVLNYLFCFIIRYTHTRPTLMATQEIIMKTEI